MSEYSNIRSKGFSVSRGQWDPWSMIRLFLSLRCIRLLVVSLPLLLRLYHPRLTLGLGNLPKQPGPLSIGGLGAWEAVINPFDITIF
jgi:hypothetical protein